MSFFKKVYDVVGSIPYGKVMSYGTVAKLCGNPRMARQVGWALHQNPSPNTIPCYRVVNRFGAPSKAFAFGGEQTQIDLLQAEGVEFCDGKVIMEKFAIILE